MIPLTIPRIAAAAEFGLLLLLAGCAGENGAGHAASSQATLPPPPAEIAPMTGQQHAAAVNDPLFVEGMRQVKAGNYGAAQSAFEHAAAAGNPIAHYMLAVGYDAGASHDLAQATDHAHIAALAGYAPAQSYLGNHYERGFGFKKDVSLALSWYAFAAAQGENIGSTRLALAKIEGNGTEKDVPTAVEILRRCADPGKAGAINGPHGGALCQAELAFIYLDGAGVPADRTEGIHWLTRAADQRFAEAERELAAFYEKGEGVPQDKVKADDLRRHAEADEGKKLDSWTPL